MHKRNVPVYFVSGGFRLIINEVADTLRVPRENVYANTLKFNKHGEYDGFDEAELTSESGGKGKVIEHLKSKFNYKRVVMIGDGATDLESCPPAVNIYLYACYILHFNYKIYVIRTHLSVLAVILLEKRSKRLVCGMLWISKNLLTS